MLKSLSIRNFRGIRECFIKDLSRVNVFIGRNGAGKSTILEAIYVASAWASVLDTLRDRRKVDYIIRRRAGRGEWANSKDILWFLMDTSRNVEISLAFSDGKTLDLKLLNRDTQGYVWSLIPQRLREETGRYRSYELYNHANGIVGTISLSAISSIIPDLRDMFLKYYGDIVGFLEKTLFIDSWFLSKPEIVEAKVWPKILAKRLDKVIVKMVREGYGVDAEGLTYMPLGGANVLALQLTKTTVRIDDLGDGVKNAILISAAMLPLEKTAVLIEDPEVHQHPGGLASLMRFVLEIAKEKMLQLFISTHSLELIRIVSKLCENMGFECKVFFVDRSSDGIVDVRVLEKEDTEVLLSLGLDPRFLHKV